MPAESPAPRSNGPHAVARDDLGEPDLVDVVLGAAWFNQYQLGLLVSLVGHMQSSEDMVTMVIDRARRLATASPAAIGAAASLLSLMRDGDEYAVAECLGRAQACFDDDELLAGALALTASLCLTVADTMGLDASMTLSTMVDAVGATPIDLRVQFDADAMRPPAPVGASSRS